VNSRFTSCRNYDLRVNWVKHTNFRAEFRHIIRYFLELALHEIRAKMNVAPDHFLAAVPNRLLDDLNRCPSHNQGTYPEVPEAVHTATFQPECTKQWVKMLI